jgi:hypothetical protein
VIGHALRETYGGAHVPGSFLTKSAQAKLDAFFRSDTAMGHDFTRMASEILAQHTHPYRYSLEENPNAKTVWHHGAETSIASTERLVGGPGAHSTFHIHVHDEHGNLVHARHGAIYDDGIRAGSAWTHPEHRGRGILSATNDILMTNAEEQGLPVRSWFKNQAVSDATIRQSQARGREALRTPEGETLFQTHDSRRNAGVHVLDRKTAMKTAPHPDFLYHGTNDAGLEGIMREGKIRALPTERNPADVRAWLTENPARAGVQGRHTIAIPRKNIPEGLLESHPLGMWSSSHDVPLFGDARDTRVGMIHSEAEPYPDLHPAEHAAYNRLAPAEKAAYQQAIDHTVQAAPFKDILGLSDKGYHFGVGVWRGAENPGIASKVALPAELTPEVKAKMDALAAAEGMAKDQGSVSWGRPLPADAPNGFPAVLLREPPTGALGAAVDKAYGDGMVGVIHGPENSTYLVDFGGQADLSKFGGEPLKWEGGYVHDERLTEMADPSAQTFQQALNNVPEAAVLRDAIARTSDEVKKIQGDFFNKAESSPTETLFQQAAEHDGPSHWQGSAAALADMHGVDIAAVPPTGEGGRVTVGDVERYIFQQMPPADQLKSLLQGLSVQRGKQAAGYSAERSKRFGEVRGILGNESLSNEEARAAAADAMRGELPKIIVNGHAREMTQETLDALVSQVRYHPTLADGQKIRVWDALNDLVHTGRVPQKGELALMRHVWGKGTTMSLIEEMTKWQKLGRNVGDIINIPRSIMSSMDVSFGLRQALVASMYDPGLWFKSWKQQFALLGKWTEGVGAEQGGEAAYKALMEHIYDSPNFPLYQQMGLAITDMEHALGLREEGFQSNLAERLTGGVHSPIRGSGRAYTGMAIKLRTELADRLLADAMAAGQDVHDEEFLSELGHFINGITGRGKFPHRVLEEGSPLLSAIFFSPRLMASRLQMLNPVHYITGNAFVRKQYIKAGLRFYGTMATILASIKYFVPGATVTFNPRSSDFGKVKLHNNRIDMGGGFNQFIHLFGMIATGEKQNTTTGQVTKLGSGKFGQMTRADAFIKFMEGKLSPSSSIVKDWASDSDPKHLGQGFNTWDEFTSHMTPLIAQDAWQVYNDPNGTGLNGIGAAIAGYGLESTGVGLQNYGPSQPGAKTLKKITAEAKATGTTIPPKVAQGMKNIAQLKSYTAAFQGDPKSAMKQYIKYYAEQTGKHDLDRYASVTSDEMAKRVMSAIRARLDNGASRYEAVIKARARAKGIK